MPQYLLSAHSVEGEAREPMTDGEMKEVMTRVGALEEEMKSAGAWVFGGRLHEAETATVVRVWPRDGIPPNPGGWITTTARNRAIDRLRRESRGRELLSEAAVLSHGNQEPEEEGPVQDDRLRLIFTCCHPALSTEAQVAL